MMPLFSEMSKLRETPMFERMSASFGLARSAWLVLLGDKKLVVFPLISGFCCLLVVASFLAPIAVSERLQKLFVDEQSPLVWAYLFAFYFVNYFVIVFFNTALVACALKRFNGEETTLGEGLSSSISRLPHIIAWALVSATVGVLLKAIENMHEKIGAIISGILGTGWSIITFFVIPILVVENTGPIDALKRSLAILKKTWGEALIGNFGLGIFTFLLLLPGLGILGVGAWLFTAVSPILGGVVVGLGVLYLILWGAASSALNGIFVSALYQYAAQGKIPGAFEPRQIEQAFRAKTA